MNFEINQLVLTPFGYGTVTFIPPLAIPYGPEINQNEILNKLEIIENEQQSQDDISNLQQRIEQYEKEIIKLDEDQVPNQENQEVKSQALDQRIQEVKNEEVQVIKNEEVQVVKNEEVQVIKNEEIQAQKEEHQNEKVNDEEVQIEEVINEEIKSEEAEVFSKLISEVSKEDNEPRNQNEAKNVLEQKIKLIHQQAIYYKEQLAIDQIGKIIKDGEDQLSEQDQQQPKAPVLDAVQVDAINQLPKLSAQTSKRNLDSPDDPFPFPNLGIVPLTSPVPPQLSPVTRKPPFIVQLSPKLSEALLRAKQIKQSRLNMSDDRMAQVKLKFSSFATISLPATSITSILFLLVKTFFGARNYYLACIPLGTQVKHLIKLVSEAACENPKFLHNIRIIHPMGTLKEFKDHNAMISDCNLMEFAQVIMLASMTFFWDPFKKGKAIVLSNNDCTANKQGDSDFQTVLGTLPMSSGSNYWELKIDKYVDEEDLFVGVARKEIDLYAQPITTGMFWGYICLCARKCGPEGVLTKYGQSAKTGDIIGVLLEFKGGVGTLSFYRNGSKCGEAFNNLTGTFYPAVGLFYGEVQITLDPKAAFPIN